MPRTVLKEQRDYAILPAQNQTEAPMTIERFVYHRPFAIHAAGEEQIRAGLSPTARIILGTTVSAMGFLMLLSDPPEQAPIVYYAFCAFCLLIGMACIARGRVRQFIGSLIAAMIVAVTAFYLIHEINHGPAASASKAAPSVLNAILAFIVFGLPSLRYLYTARFGFATPKPESGTVPYRVYIDQEPGGHFLAHCPDLPGLATEGATEDEAFDAFQNALDTYYEELSAEGIAGR